MTKTERKVIEKLALSVYAKHLYNGLATSRYSLEDAKRYWEYAKANAGGHCPDYTPADANIFTLLDDYRHNVAELEELIAAREAAIVPALSTQVVTQ